jgi:hypothetical protein
MVRRTGARGRPLGPLHRELPEKFSRFVRPVLNPAIVGAIKVDAGVNRHSVPRPDGLFGGSGLQATVEWLGKVRHS